MSNILNAWDSEEDVKDEKDGDATQPKPITMSIDKNGGNHKSNQKKKKLTGLDASDDNDGDSGRDFELSESNSESDFDPDGGDSTDEELGILTIFYIVILRYSYFYLNISAS